MGPVSVMPPAACPPVTSCPSAPQSGMINSPVGNCMISCSLLKLEEDTSWTPDCKQETVGGKTFSPSVICVDSLFFLYINKMTLALALFGLVLTLVLSSVS